MVIMQSVKFTVVLLVNKLLSKEHRVLRNSAVVPW